MSLKRNLLANYIGQAWVGLMGLAFLPLYIKHLGAEAFGLIGLCASLQAWLTVLDVGMAPTISREMARFSGTRSDADAIRDLLRSIELIAVLIAGFVAVGMLLAAPWLASSWLKAQILSLEVVANSIAIMGFVVVLRFLEGIYRSALLGLQRQVLFNVINCVVATLRWGGALGIIVWVSNSIASFFIWQGLVSFFSIFILAVATYRSIPKGNRKTRFSLTELRKIWRFARGIMIITLLAMLLTQIDKILLSKLLSLSDFGLYTLASTVAATLYLLVAPITQAYYPKFCELHSNSDHAEFARYFHVSAQMVSILAGSAALVIIFFSETLLRVWTQDPEQAQKIALLVSMLTLGNLLNGLMWIPYQAQLAHGLTSLTLKANLIAVATLIPLIWYLVPMYGALAVAHIWIFLNACYIIILAPIMFHLILKHEKCRWYLNDILRPLMIMAVAAYFLKQILEPLKSGLVDIGMIIFSGFLLSVIGFISNKTNSNLVIVFLKKKLLIGKLGEK